MSFWLPHLPQTRVQGLGMDLHIVLIILLVSVAMVTSQTCTSPTVPVTDCDCFVDPDGLKVINCRYKSLTQVPAFANNGVIYDKIIFTSTEDTGTCTPGTGCNAITSLSADSFANLNVKEIDLRNNAITSFDTNAFRGLETTLNGLFIEGDGSNAPPYNSISVLQNLRSLHLENFQQTDMSASNTNLPFPELLTLTLDKLQQVRSIQNTVFQTIPKVVEFNLHHMPQLVTLPVNAIRELQSLTSLKVLNTRVQRIFGFSFDNLDNLHSIHFDSNADLTTIDNTAFSGVTDTLEFLYMNQNSLTSAMLDMFNDYDWPVLTQLHLGYNTFGTIPSGKFSTLSNLVYLELQDVGLTSIDDTMFTGLQNLHTLDLGYNMISSVAIGTFQNSPNLKELRMNEQQLTSSRILFAQNAFEGIEESLERLLIERNNINPSDLWSIVQSLTNIVELNLAGLGFTSIPDQVFRFNTKLSTLDLSENNFTEVKQETFYGPRATLRTVNLYSNQISTVSRCALSDFSPLPSLRLNANPLICDCRIAWLYDWVYAQPDPTTAAVNHVGTCSAPASLQGQFFFDFGRDNLTCAPGYQPPVCLDLYTTTTPKTTTTTTPTSTTLRPKPFYDLLVGPKTSTSIALTWTVTDKTDVTGYLLEMSPPIGLKVKLPVHKDSSQHTFTGLATGSPYLFCLFLELNNDVDYTPIVDNERYCKTATPTDATTTALPTTTAEPESQTQIGIIIGAVVGGTILIVLLIIIICLLLRSSKSKKERKAMTEGVKFTSHAGAPSSGTGRRYAKKPDQEGTSADNIGITVISDPDMNKDRMSAGSYQFLNEKNPRGGVSKVTNGHYANDFDTRPLPKAPGGATGQGSPTGLGSHNYVNEGFKSSSDPLPETSSNLYNEVKY